MGVVPENMQVKGGKYISGREFDGTGLLLRVQGMTVEKSTNPKYGAMETDWLVKEKKVAVGETISYQFKTVPDPKDKLAFVEERVFNSKAVGFFFAFTKVNPSKDELVLIKRSGTGTDTQYSIEKVTPTVVVDKGYVYPVSKDIDPKDIPF